MKKQYGQFYTKRYDYIFDGIKPLTNVKYIEPFAGEGDLAEYIGSAIELYDIDPKCEGTIKRDTLKNPPDYTDKYIISNPPYLARNKNKDKTYYDMYNENDLYRCFIKSFIKGDAKGGQIIIPLNFWSSIRNSDCELRKIFLKYYEITRLNIFEEQVFDDTSYTVCAFQFVKKKTDECPNIDTFIYPQKKNIKIELSEDNGWIIGGELYNLPTSETIRISRLMEGEKPNTNILLYAIDSGTTTGRIRLELSEQPYFGLSTSRSFATLTIIPKINESMQKNIVEKFNEMIEEYREKYHSLFLTNYRESKDYARKRISFDLVYQMVNYIICNYN